MVRKIWTLLAVTCIALTLLIICLAFSSSSSFAENKVNEQEEALASDGEQPEEGSLPEEEEIIEDGWYVIEGLTYYYMNGEPLTGLNKIDGEKYYFNKKGVMKTGFREVKGKTYFFDKDTGAAKTGHLRYKGKKYYFKDSGVMFTGKIKIGKYYRFYKRSDGSMLRSGFARYGKHKYYFDKKGRMVTGKKKIKGKTRYFTWKGVYKPKLTRTTKKIWNSSSDTPYYICINKRSRKVFVMKGRKQGWRRIKKISCSIGAPGTPTPSGRFKINGKVLHFGENKGYTCWYASAFIGRMYLMHSVVCYQGTKTPSDGRLGMAISHGCVRMPIGSAKWIYNKIPVGTPVYIY